MEQEEGEAEGGILREAAPLKEVKGEEDEEEDDKEDEEIDEDNQDLYQATIATGVAFEEMFTRPPRARPPHPDAEGSDAWDPAPPSAALIEPGAERVRAACPPGHVRALLRAWNPAREAQV